MCEPWVVQSLRAIVSDLSDESLYDVMTFEAAEGYQWRIEMIYRDLLAKEIVHGSLGRSDKEALECLSEAYSGLSVFIDMPHSPLNETNSHLAPIIATGAIGRPRFEIACGQLQCLIDNRFSVPQIAKLLSVSVSTIRRRMLDFNLSINATYSTITDDELDDLVCSVQNQYPYWGNRQMYGCLISRGIRVQHFRVRESQCRVDPAGSMLRRLRTLRRRRYSVQGPQHLWHIDGHHKLIRSVKQTIG